MSHRITSQYLPVHRYECTRTMVTNQTVDSWRDIPPHRKHSSATSSLGPAAREKRVLFTQYFFRLKYRTALTGNAALPTSLQNLRSTDLPSLRTQSSMRVLMPFPHTALLLSWQVLQSAGRFHQQIQHTDTQPHAPTRLTNYLLDSCNFYCLW